MSRMTMSFLKAGGGEGKGNPHRFWLKVSEFFLTHSIDKWLFYANP